MAHGFWSLLPAILAIALALTTRNVILSLFGAVAAAGIIHIGHPVGGVVHALDSTIVGAIADADHAKTLLFTVLIGAMVGVIGKSGGTRAVVEGLAKRAKSPRSVMVLSWLSGLIVFFDDYANCMIVGSAMGPLCDRYKISRAKLAYIVDSTAAPVASLALVSTWVGFEVGVVEEGLKAAGQQIEPYGFFVQTWGYRFYPILAMLFVGFVAFSGRDFGPMVEARNVGADADTSAELEETGDAPWWVAIIPVVTLVFMTLFILYRSGSAKAPADPALFQILENADGYGAIMQGSFSALLVALVLSLVTKSLSLKEATEASLAGMTLMFEALVVLVLAWSLSSAMKELEAPAYLVSVLGDQLSPQMLPTFVFLVGAAISFAVGSSYATMGIMMPMVIPLAYQLGADAVAAGDMTIPLASAGSVLAGACFGDHCSPISDTTVLSAIGSGSDLLLHVRTQLPYALLVGVASVVLGTIPAGFGVNPWLLCLLGLGACGAFLFWRGKPQPEPSKTATIADS